MDHMRISGTEPLFTAVLMVSIKIEYRVLQQRIWETIFSCNKIKHFLTPDHSVHDGRFYVKEIIRCE